MVSYGADKRVSEGGPLLACAQLLLVAHRGVGLRIPGFVLGEGLVWTS